MIKPGDMLWFEKDQWLWVEPVGMANFRVTSGHAMVVASCPENRWHNKYICVLMGEKLGWMASGIIEQSQVK